MDKLSIKTADTHICKDFLNKFNLTNQAELRMISVTAKEGNVKKERWSHEFSQGVGSGASVQRVSRGDPGKWLGGQRPSETLRQDI